MPSSFGQYTGGIAPVQGISEAGARIGQMAQQGYQDFGKSLAGGIQAYNENSAKNDILTSEAEALGSQIQQFAAQFGDSPEHKAFADSLQPYIEQLSKVPSMSLTQKMGAVTGVKAGFANIGQQLQIFEMMRKEKLQRTMAEAGYLAPKNSMVYNPSALKAGTVSFDPNKSPTQNISDFDTLIKKAQADGHEIDANDARQKYLANIKQSIDSDQKIDPRLKATLKDQIEAYNQYQENSMTDESGVTDYSKESELYGKVETSALDKMKQDEKVSSYSATNFAPEWLLNKAKQEKVSEANGQLIIQQSAVPVSNELIKNLLDKVKGGETVTPNIVLSELKKAESSKNPAFDMVKLPEFSSMPSSSMGAGYARYSEKNTNIGVSSPATDAVVSALGKINKTEDQPLNANDILSLTNSVSNEVPKFTDATNKLLEQTKNPTLESQPEQPTVAPITNQQDIIVGSKADIQPTTFDEKKQAMQEYFMSKYKDASGKSYLPAGFDEAFKASNPEANFHTMDTKYGSFMWNGKEWNQIKTAQPLSNKERREEMRGIFGTQTDKGFVPMQIGEGTGVRIHGVFTGSDGDLGKYKDNISAMSSARSAIAELRSIIGQFGHSLNPTLIGRAKIAMATLRAATRIEVIGVGTVSEMEQKMLNDANPDTTKTFSLDSVDIAKLDSLSYKIDNKMKMESTMNGVTVILQPPTFGKEGRQAIEEGLRQRNPQLYRR